MMLTTFKQPPNNAWNLDVIIDVVARPVERRVAIENHALFRALESKVADHDKWTYVLITRLAYLATTNCSGLIGFTDFNDQIQHAGLRWLSRYVESDLTPIYQDHERCRGGPSIRKQTCLSSRVRLQSNSFQSCLTQPQTRCCVRYRTNPCPHMTARPN